MKRIALSVLVILLSTQIVFAELIKGSFLMTEFEDGKQTEDLFEIWTIKANLSSTNPAIQIQAASFVSHAGETRVFPWLHESTQVSQVSPGIYKAELNGRLNPFSGLEVVLELSPGGRKIQTISGSMRAGTRGQSVSVFKPDLKTPNKKIQLVNPSYSYGSK